MSYCYYNYKFFWNDKSIKCQLDNSIKLSSSNNILKLIEIANAKYNKIKIMEFITTSIIR